MNQEPLPATVERQVKRMRQAVKERTTFLRRTVYLGTLGVMLVLPIVIGAYLGAWLDGHIKGFSFSWTVTLILLGVFVGALSAYTFIRQSWT